MATEIRVPTLGESVTEATIGRWFKKPGDAVKADEPLVELETDKVTLEVNAPAAGVLSEIIAKDGDTVSPGAMLGRIGEGVWRRRRARRSRCSAPPLRPRSPLPLRLLPPSARRAPPSPAAAKNAADRGINVGDVAGSGKRGQVLKGDVLGYAAAPPAAARVPRRSPSARRPPPTTLRAKNA